MSYLSFPRLQFSGGFTANPSTINNTPTNYDEPESTNPNAAVIPSWNPYGSASFAIAGKVEGCLDPSGGAVGGSDAALTATFKNVTSLFNVPAKLVDLDTDEQTHTRFFGLFFQFNDASGNLLFQGYFEPQGCLKNLWFGRVPSASGDNVAGGAMQSVFPVDLPPLSGKNVNLQWGDISASPFLQQLQAASPDGLSINFTGYGYQGDNNDPKFQAGLVVGAIGPYLKGEPRYKIAGRMLSPVPGSSMWNSAASISSVTAGTGTQSILNIDLSNAIPEQSTGGAPIDQGAMWAAILPAGQPPVLLGQYDYQNQFLATGGILALNLTADQVTLAAANPLAILTVQGPGQSVTTPQGPMFITLQENSDGIAITTDQSTVYMNPDEPAYVDLYASKFGAPLPAYPVPLSLVPPSPPANNDPAGALVFPATVTTDANGTACIKLSASNPAPKPERRKNIDGQLYFVGGPWSAQYNANSQAPSAFTVKIFNSMEIPAAPTWVEDVGPILYQYYILYAYMINFFDLSNYESVKGASGGIKSLINLPLDDPRKMPVTRELSRDAITVITNWIDQGCAPGESQG
jgi:hypothetical protein